MNFWVCWYCYWGWSKPVHDIYIEALRKLNNNESVLINGPSHIVWEDENFRDAKWCLDNFKTCQDIYKNIYTEKELEICKWSLEELEKLPLELRCIEPIIYDGKNPKLFPPDVETFKH